MTRAKALGTRPAVAVLIGLLPLLIVIGLYLLFGHRLVSAMYHGRSIALLNGIIEQQKHVPLVHYLRKADALCVMLGSCYTVLLIVGTGYWFGRGRSSIRRAFGVLIYVMVLAIVGELSARVFFLVRGIDINIYRNYSFRAIDNLLVADRDLGFRLAPSEQCYAICSDFEVLYETNELGLRERPVEHASLFRILFLGDSVTFGWGVPYGERFTELVGDMIPGVQTINAGVPGYGLHQMQRWLEEDGMALEPDLVICSVIFQDLNRAAIATVPDVEPTHIVRKTTARPTGNPHQEKEEFESSQELPRLDLRNMLHSGLLTVSDLYAFLRVKIAISTLNQKIQDRQRTIEQARRAPGNVLGDAAWVAHIQQATADILDELASLLSHSHVPCMVVNISPFAIEWLQPLLDARGIDYLDLSSTLSGKQGITFEIDPHYNRKGHAVIAEGLAEAIVDRYGNDISARGEPGHP